MFDEPLVWIEGEGTWTATLEVEGGGEIVITQTPSTVPPRIPDCFVATLTIADEIFPIKSTEFMKCFDLPQCKKICYDYWQNFLMQILFNGLPI